MKPSKQTVNKLIEAATKVRKHAYAPYSKFAVGAAVMCENGHIFDGCNVENVALGLSICAERSAIVKAFSEGCRDIEVIAIVTDSPSPSSPCGICRQVLYEFNPKMTVVLANLQGDAIIKSATDLLPFAFKRHRENDSIEPDKVKKS